MARFAWVAFVVSAFLAAPEPASAQTYWLGRKPDPEGDEYVFDVAVPADLAAVLACSGARYAKFKDGVKEIKKEVGGKSYTFLQNDMSWDKDLIDRGAIAFRRKGAVTVDGWVDVSTKSDAWKACREVLLAQRKKEKDSTWSNVAPIVLLSDGTDNPNLTVDFGLPFHYWLGRRPDPKTDEYVFDVAVPTDLALALSGTDPRYARLKDGVNEFQWEIDGKTYTLIENPLSWEGDRIEQGAFAFSRNGGVMSGDDWTKVSAEGKAWEACLKVLLEQKKTAANGWSEVTPIVLRTEGKDNPNGTIDFNADVPFKVAQRPTDRKPQIVPVVKKDALFIAYQTWGRTGPTGKVVIVKAPLSGLSGGKLTVVRQVPSGGTLVGFTVDDDGADYTLTARAEEFPNRPEGNFLDAIDKPWREGVLTLYTGDAATDLNSDKYTTKTFYGICNAGSGRLVAGGGRLAAVFARRLYSRDDHLIHQAADALLASADLSQVLFKAQNVVAHSFDQRLIYDGQDFVSLHQGDVYPVAGLIIEKIRTNPGDKPVAVRFPAYSCPTFGNDVFFDLGGVAAEKDGYPVLFSSTHNTEPVNPQNVRARGDVAWDLGMAYVVRDFDARPEPKNPYDIVGSGILAGGYGKREELTFENFTWDPQTSSFTKRDPRTVTRRVQWLTAYGDDKAAVKKAVAPKLVQLGEGKYIVLYEEQTLAGKEWKYEQTWATTLTIEGEGDAKQIKKGESVSLKALRLHRGDDPVALTLDGKAVAAWVTAGETNRRLTLHTVGADLKYTAVPLRLP